MGSLADQPPFTGGAIAWPRRAGASIVGTMPSGARPSSSVVTIGNFDGVHLGHAALIRRARRIAGDGGRVIALVFDPHPLSFLRPSATPARLSTFEQRRRWLSELRVDDVHRLEPTKELLSLSPEAFLEALVEEHHPSAIVEGSDFCFGKGRAGDVETLRELSSRFGYSAEIVPTVEGALDDELVIPVSSTNVRGLVREGRMRDAAALLGRPYEIVGRVVEGDRRGREIGCPTANLDTPLLAPRDGVYAGLARLDDGRTFPAAVSVGTKPAFGDDLPRAVEAHLLGWDGPIPEGAPEYGWTLRLEVRHWLRDQAPYPSVDALMTQIKRDIERTRAAIETDLAHAPTSLAGASA